MRESRGNRLCRGNSMCRGREPKNTSIFWKHSTTQVGVDKTQARGGRGCGEEVGQSSRQ